mmetsp:Transcript_25684/g.37840  ORF Transcript_25684/g.37840 Transcript_25684/m.37840 type:complete len:2829 (+) Transcript_25684:179-8665(+)
MAGTMRLAMLVGCSWIGALSYARPTVSVVTAPHGRGDFAFSAPDGAASRSFVGKQTDCQEHAVLGSARDRVGDGFCDDGAYGAYDFFCAKFSFDGGDCGDVETDPVVGVPLLSDRDQPKTAEADAELPTSEDAVPEDSCQNVVCGERSAATCWCDATCADYGDCCGDFATYCADTKVRRRLADTTEAPYVASCEGLCGGMDVKGNCYCGAECRGYGDCCEDFEDTCGYLTTAAVSDGETDRPICQGCADCCGTSYRAENEDGSSCSCNTVCTLFGDCCDDFELECDAYTEEPITKCFDCDGTSCIGFERFVGDGICDDSSTTLNFDCSDYNYDGGDCASDGNTFNGSCAGECGQLVSYFDNTRRRQLFSAPNSTSCDGLCGYYTQNCHCTLDCTDYDDCCDDYVEACETRFPAPGDNWHDIPQERHCWCDESCVSNADCCEDYFAQCDAEEGMASSCEGACGEKRASGCWCDKICVDHNDCCDDYEALCGCGEYSYQSCTGCTDSRDACNYDPDSTIDDGSCTYPVDGFNCDGECLERVDCDGVCGGPKYLDACDECVLPEDRGQSADCAGVCFGSTEYDECGICGGTKTASQCECPNSEQERDCAGACNGVKTLNVCGVCTGNSDKLAFIDCFGVCFGSGVEDECGVCNGDGSSCQDGYCDADRVADCAGVCDGTLVKDNCGICGGNGATRDCAGVCTGPLLEDECGVCGGNGTSCLGCTDEGACNYWVHASIDDGSCSYPESTLHDCSGKCSAGIDCFGICGGSAELDECGVCNGYGASCTTPFCFGGKVDCWGECNGGAVEDACGVCDGDSSVCRGCMDSTGCNFNPSAELPPLEVDSIRLGLELNGCSYPPDENFDCNGVCTKPIDCHGICGGPYVLDDCQVCGLNSGSGSTCCAYEYELFEGTDSRRLLVGSAPTPNPGHGNSPTGTLSPTPGEHAADSPTPAPVDTGFHPAPGHNGHGAPAPKVIAPGPDHDNVPAPIDHSSCVGYCGKVTPNGCWCDRECTNYNDCCYDIVDACGGTGEGSFPIPAPGDVVVAVPSPQHVPAPGSHQTNAPAPHQDAGPAPTHINPAPVETNHPAPKSNHSLPAPHHNIPAPNHITSCLGQCLNTLPIFGGCYCDASCITYQDCCDDFFDFCAPNCVGEFCADGVVDCAGECDGTHEYDACEVCGGDSSTCVGGQNPWWCLEGYDCFGVCGGFSVIDTCGVCGGFGSSCGFPTDTDSDGLFNGEPYCFTGFRDCAGECDGTREFDECLVCGGDGSTCSGCLKSDACNYDAQAVISSNECYYAPSSTTNCFGYCDQDFDCLGVCGGSKVTDSCGVCGGFGATCRKPATSDFCSTGTVDCFGECDGSAELDACGVCSGDSSSCTGCTDTTACNYSPYASISDTSCLYFEDAPGVYYDNCLGKCEPGFDCEGTCGGSVKYDLCGVCGGNAWNVGCDGVCFSEKVADSCGVCGGYGDSCQDGYCSGGYVADCFGECGGTAELDLCGVCNGFNKLRDCTGVCFGSAFLDACGICGGDSSQCTGCGDYNACNFDINAVVSDDSVCLYPKDHNYDCWGNCVVDIDCTGLCDGDNEIDACGVCGGDSSICVGCMDSTACNYDDTAILPSLSQCFYDSSMFSCTGICKQDVDCGGNCGGYLSLDACGVCNGDSSSCVGCTNPVACNYDETATIDDGSCDYAQVCNGVCTVSTDCAGECGGTLVIDECDVCGGFGASCVGDDEVFCTSGTVDCKGECDGGRVYDACGVCDGDTTTCIGCNDEDACNYLDSATIGVPAMCTYPASDSLDCNGNCIVGVDCKGYCGGTSEIDVCGVCGGFGASCTENYCEGGRIDCAGECAGGRTIDSCGVCGGNDATCTLVDFCVYGIVDCFGYCHCPFETDDPEACLRPVLDAAPADVCTLFNDGSFEGFTSTKTYEEVSSLGSWDQIDNGGAVYISASEASYWGDVASSDGTYFAVLLGAVGINQTVHATHWNYYLLSFDLASRPNDGMGTLYVNVDGTRIFESIVPDVAEFQEQRVLFQAESDSVNIEFVHDTSDSSTAVYIDNVEMSLSSQVLLDGGFEGLSTTSCYQYTSYLGAWTGSGVLIHSTCSAWGGLEAPEGYHYYGEQGDGWLSQYMPTEVGSNYVLNFYAAARPNYGMETLYVYVDSVLTQVLELLDTDDAGTVGFQRFKLNFRAANALTKIEFHHRVQSGDLTLFLDAISAEPTTDLALSGSFEGVSVSDTYESMSNPGSWKGDVVVVRSGDDTWGGILTPTGSYYAVLMASKKITQTLPTTIGNSYKVSFSVSCRPDYGMEKMFVIIDGLTVYTLVVEDSVSWAKHTLNFIAGARSTVVSLYHGPSATGSSNTAVYIDNVVITPTTDVVIDGGFEGISTSTTYEYTDSYLDMWTGSGVIIYSENEDWGGLAAPEGNYYVGRQGSGLIQQNLTTTPGQHYELSFETAARPDYGADILHVILQGVLVYQLKLEDTGAFAPHTLNYQADSDLTLVTFQHVIESDGNLTVLLDDVTSTPTADLVIDGGFEGLALTTAHHNVSSDEGTLGAWTGEGVIVRSGNAAYGKMEAVAGDYLFALPAQTSIAQVLQTEIGVHYTVDFSAAPRPTYGAEALTVHIRDEIVYVLELADDAAFEQHSLNFYANTSETELRFEHAESGADISILLDNIKISQSENLVIDGSFEGISTTLAYEYMADGDLGAWEDAGANTQHIIVFSKNGAWGGLAAPVGDYYVSLQRSTDISQYFHTEKGSFYVLSFYVASRPNYGMGTLTVSIDGEAAHTIVGADSTFEKMSYLFTAESDLIHIHLAHAVSDNADETVFLDDIQLVKYTEAAVGSDQAVSC